MIYELKDTLKAAGLFEGWKETLIYSCLQGIMGKVLVTDPETPESAMAYVGCFCFYAGKPDRALALCNPFRFAIMVPRDEKWGELIEDCYPNARKVERYAIKKDTHFDRAALQKNVEMLSEGYELRPIDGELYDLCLKDGNTIDFVSSFAGKEDYLKLGRGMVILKDGIIVSGASSYSRYQEGIEIEVDTIPAERRKHLALIVCSALILRCLDEGLYPSWDAQNMGSVHLSEKLGYEFDHPYTAYVVEQEKILTTERLFLRRMRYEDFDALNAVLGDDENMRHYPHPFTERHVRDWIQRNLNRYEKDGFGLWAVCLKETGEMIGDCGLTLQNIDGEMLPEIGYHIRKDMQHRGYAKEAAAAALQWAFDHTDYPAVYSYCKYTNEASWKTAEAIGMQFVKEYQDAVNTVSHVSVAYREQKVTV